MPPCGRKQGANENSFHRIRVGYDFIRASMYGFCSAQTSRKSRQFSEQTGGIIQDYSNPSSPNSTLLCLLIDEGQRPAGAQPQSTDCYSRLVLYHLFEIVRLLSAKGAAPYQPGAQPQGIAARSISAVSAHHNARGVMVRPFRPVVGAREVLGLRFAPAQAGMEPGLWP